MSEMQVWNYFIRENLYPFQISMNYAEVVHILQAVRNASQLDNASVSLLRG